MLITRMDLGGMEAMQATVNMDPWLDKAIAIAVPLLLVLITWSGNMSGQETETWMNCNIQ